MILMLFLLAPTVPSDPRPQNFRLLMSLGVVSGSSVMGRLLWVTSSTMPIVKPWMGCAAVRFRKAESTAPGVVSLLPRP